MESRFSNIKDRLIRSQNKIAMIPKLQQHLNEAKITISTSENELQRRDQPARMNNIEISGIPIAADENLLKLYRQFVIRLVNQ